MSRALALRWAALGWRPIPIHSADKRPILKEWPLKASSGVGAVGSYWIDGAGVGLAMGLNPATGKRLVVVDLDTKGANGVDTLRAAGIDPDAIETLQVRTPSGGRHMYFETSEPVRTLVNVLPGVDTRGEGGQVVAPGTITEKGAYTVTKNMAPAPLPEALALVLAAAITPNIVSIDARTRSGFVAGEGAEGLDGAEDRSRRYLSALPEVPAGEGNATLFKRAAKVRDFGLTRETTLALMLDHVDEKFLSEMDEKEIRKTVRSAFDNAQSAWGRDAIRPVDLTPTEPVDARIYWYDGTADTAATIPPRPWLVEGLLMREIVSVLVAPGATGKSTWTLQALIALALADVLPRDVKAAMVGERYADAFRAPAKCLLINNEDSRDELSRRVEAICIQWGIPREKLHGRLAMSSGAAREWKAAIRNEARQIVEGPEVAELKGFIRANGIDVIVCDPLVSFHDASENNNDEMQRVTSVFKSIAAELRVSCLMVHHTTKPPMASSDSYAGNINSARGASAVKDAARAGFTMYGCGKTDGEGWGIAEERRHAYVRLDDAKNNLTLGSGDPQWFVKTTVKLPNGDAVGVLVAANGLQRVEKKSAKSSKGD